MKTPTYELLLDFDNIKSHVLKRIFKYRIWCLKQLGISIYDIAVYQTAHGFHIRMQVYGTELSDFDRCFLQLLLGSDLKREMFNYIRIKKGIKRWNVLFEGKHKKTKSGYELVSEERYSKRLTGDMYEIIYDTYKKQER